MNSRTSAIFVGAGACTIAASAWYAFTSPRIERNTSAVQSPERNTGESSGDATPPLDRGAFDVVLWHEPPPPPEPKQPQHPVVAARPTPPPDVDLLAIGLRGETYEAVFYDKRTDRLLTLRVGASIDGYELRAITPVRVDFLYDTKTVSFDLDQPRIAERLGNPSDAPSSEASDE